MIAGASLLASLGILSAVAALVCGLASGLVFRPADAASDAHASRQSKVLLGTARLCLGTCGLLALAAGVEIWMSPRPTGCWPEVPRSSAWGALCVYLVALLAEWRILGLSGAARRTIVGWLLAGVGTLFAGISLDSWANLHVTANVHCEEGVLPVAAATPSARAVAALALALVPLAGMALRLDGPRGLTPSSAAATVAMAVWLQPLLMPQGWLPSSLGGGPLALLLVAAVMLLGKWARAGPRATLCGVAGYFALSVGGAIVLGIL